MVVPYRSRGVVGHFSCLGWVGSGVDGNQPQLKSMYRPHDKRMRKPHDGYDLHNNWYTFPSGFRPTWRRRLQDIRLSSRSGEWPMRTRSPPPTIELIIEFSYFQTASPHGIDAEISQRKDIVASRGNADVCTGLGLVSPAAFRVNSSPA